MSTREIAVENRGFSERFIGRGAKFLGVLASRASTGQRGLSDQGAILEIACGAARNKFPDLKTIVGIAIDAPKFVDENSEDLILMDCENWTEEQRAHYEGGNKRWDFFRSSSLKETHQRATEFLPSQTGPRQVAGRTKTGRNDLVRTAQARSTRNAAEPD